MAKISVVVPVYKVEKYLDECVESILAQTFTDFELILVDDGSPDACPKMCDAWATKDARVSVIHQENKGLLQARNTGIRAAKGEWITFVDSDDCIAPELFQTLYDTAIDTGADFVQSGAVREKALYNAEIQGSAKRYEREEIVRVIVPVLMQRMRDAAVSCVAWGKLYRKSLLQNAQAILCSGVRCYGEDCLLTLCVAGHSHTIAVLEDTKLYYYRVNQDSIVHHYVPQTKEDIACFVDTYFQILQEISMLSSETKQEVWDKRCVELLALCLMANNPMQEKKQQSQYLQHLLNTRRSIVQYAKESAMGYRLMLLCAYAHMDELAVLVAALAQKKGELVSRLRSYRENF